MKYSPSDKAATSDLASLSYSSNPRPLQMQPPIPPPITVLQLYIHGYRYTHIFKHLHYPADFRKCVDSFNRYYQHRVWQYCISNRWSYDLMLDTRMIVCYLEIDGIMNSCHSNLSLDEKDVCCMADAAHASCDLRLVTSLYLSIGIPQGKPLSDQPYTIH